MASVREVVLDARGRLLSLYGEKEAAAAVSVLFSHVFSLPSHYFITEPGMELDGERCSEFFRCVTEMEAGRPLQYVTGEAWFMSRKFRVAEGVLIPRPETEELFAMAAAFLKERTTDGKGLKVIDFCTGSGCLAWSFAAEFPGASVYACDLSEEALAIACSQNISENKPVFFRTDVLDMEKAAGDLLKAGGNNSGFDLIVSNPPYVMERERLLMRKNVLDYEPEMALFVPDGNPLLFYTALAELTARLLSREGRAFFEINENLGPETCEEFRRFGLDCTLHSDLFGKSRFVCVSGNGSSGYAVDKFGDS